MKKFVYLALCLIPLIGISSCSKEKCDINQAKKDDVRVVNFLAKTQDEVNLDTRSGVKLKVVHTWLYTKVENIHLFEENNNGTILQGEDVKIDTKEPYELATFTAGFYNSIIVNPETKASKVYTYTGIVAQRNEKGKYFIPEVQYPNAETWIDPDADFMIGKAFNQNSTLSEKPIEFTFKRPVATSRLAITNIEGTYLKSVTITSEDDLTGSVGFSDIDFDNCTAKFTDGSKVLKMVFAEDTKVSGTTYANFVSTLGTKHVTKVEVKTDKYLYTKNLDVNATFAQGTFMNIAMDMTPNGNKCTREEVHSQNLTFKKGDSEIIADNYDLASEDPYVSPTIEGAVDGTTFTYASSDTEIATVTGEGGELIVTPVAVGEVTISATAAPTEGYEETKISYTLTITNTDTPVTTTYYKASVVDPGYEYIIVSEGKALANNEGAVAAEAVSVESDKITLEDASSMLWTAVAETSSDLLQYGAYHLTNDGKYLSRISGGGSTSNLEIHASTDDAIATKMKYTMWDNDAENFWNISIYNSSASKYYAYVSSNAWVINTTEPSVKVAFFTARQPQALAFSGNTAVYDLGTSAYTTALPTLSGAKTTVSYSSSDESVATVNTSTGAVTPVAKGSTVITAKAVGTAEYQAAEASYTLTVIDSKSTDIVLNRATAVKDGGMYIIVNNGKALQNNSGALGAVTADMDNERTTITFDKDTNLDNLVWTWTSSSLSENYGDYTITNGSDYLYVTGSYSEGYEGHIGNYGTTDVKYVVWRYKSNQVQNGSNNAQRYLTYDDGWKVPSSASSHDTYLFEYVDPRTPQTLTFAQPTPSIDIAGTTTYKQEVSGASTTVTYSISANPSDAATIAADGTVTATKKGTAVITATAAATKDYQGASASYTLTINNSAAVAEKFYKVTPADIAVGKSYLIVSNGKALKNDNGSVAAADVTDVSGVIELDDYDALVWTAGTPTYTESDYPGYTYTNGGKKLNRNSGNIQLTSASNDKYYNFAYAEDGTSGKYTFMCGTHYYTGYDSGWKAPTSKVYVTLYCSEKPKTSRNLAFAQTSVQKNIGDLAFTITLNGNTTGGVTYSSSATNVATVNATTGEVSIVAAGTTTIKAECAETNDYKAGEASYTLTVVDPSKTKTYTKVTGNPDSNKEYILVSNGYALLLNGSSIEGKAVSVVDDKIIIAESDENNLLWKMESNSGYYFTNSGHTFTVYCCTDKNPYTYTVALGSGTNGVTVEGKSYGFKKLNYSGSSSYKSDMGNGMIYYRGNSNSQFIYYDTVNSKWNNKQDSNGTQVDNGYKTYLYQVVTE